MRHDHASLTLLGVSLASAFVLGVAFSSQASQPAPTPMPAPPAAVVVSNSLPQYGEPQAPLDTTVITPRESAGASD